MEPRAPIHAFEDHTGEVRMRVEAGTLAELFEEAARGLAELMQERPAPPDPGSAEHVRLRARDAEALLVDWLNELVFLSDTRERVYTDVRVTHITDTELEATVAGATPEALRTAVKAATLHGLAVRRSAEGYSASVVLDV
jgi:SHS2 domain-containing protein